MTYSYIRGTDFKLYNKKAENAGGFHAIVAYLIDNTADYIQATGRVARQGKKGSFIEIYNREDLDILQIDVQDPKGVSLVPKKREENA